MVGDRAGPGFGIRIDRAQLRGLHPLRLFRRDHPTHSQQELPTRALLRVVFQQDARPAGQASGRRSADRGRRRGGDRRFSHEPRRIPSKKWRELIEKVGEADPLQCLKCSREMRIVSLIDEKDVIERIRRHLGLRQEGGACIPAPTCRAKRPSIRGSTTPNRSWRSPPPETSGSAQVRLSHPLFSGPQPSGGRVRARPATRSPCLTVGPTFVTLRTWKRTLSASDSGPTPRRAKTDFLSIIHEDL